MDPGPQIYLSNNNKKYWSKIVFEQQKQKNISEKNFFQKKFGKTKFGNKFFLKKI